MTSEAWTLHCFSSSAMMSNGDAEAAFLTDTARSLDSTGGFATHQGGTLISMTFEAWAVSENQRAETRLTDYARQITSGGGKPGQGYPAILTSSTEASPARTSAWPANGPVFGASAAVSGMSSSGCCPSCGHYGASLRMFPDCFPPTGVPISVSYSGGWMTSGTVSRGEFWTRAGSELPRDAVVSSLSAVLETRAVPRKYWLSAKAAAGILRRAAKRGKTLPPRLMTALKGLVSSYR